jgi:hypothetical protein
MPFSVAPSSLIRTLNPAAVSTRAAYSFRRKPWTPDYSVRAATEAAANLVGVNYPGTLSPRLAIIAGAGAANGSAPFSYDTPAGSVSLPTTANVTAATDYANAFLVVWDDASRTVGTLVPRIATGGADPASGPFWRVTDANTISTARNVAAGVYSDWTPGQILEVFVPVASEIVTLVAVTAATQGIGFATRDFLVADTGTVWVDRVFH